MPWDVVAAVCSACILVLNVWAILQRRHNNKLQERKLEEDDD